LEKTTGREHTRRTGIEQMNSTDLFRHRQTGQYYVICRAGNGDLIGSAGPLGAEDMVAFESVLIGSENNDWIQKNATNLLLVHPLEAGEDELSELGAGIAEITEELVQWDIKGIGAQTQLPKLDAIIQRLMDLSALEQDEEFRLLLAMLEMNARKCRRAILRRAGMEN